MVECTEWKTKLYKKNMEKQRKPLYRASSLSSVLSIKQTRCDVAGITYEGVAKSKIRKVHKKDLKKNGKEPTPWACDRRAWERESPRIDNMLMLVNTLVMFSSIDIVLHKKYFQV